MNRKVKDKQEKQDKQDVKEVKRSRRVKEKKDEQEAKETKELKKRRVKEKKEKQRVKESKKNRRVRERKEKQSVKEPKKNRRVKEKQEKQEKKVIEIPLPRNNSTLFRYIKRYIKIVGWNKKDTQLVNSNCTIKKVDIKKEEDGVLLSLLVHMYHKNNILYKNVSKKYTLENAKDIKDDIIRVLSQAKYNPYIKDDNLDLNGLLENGWKTRFKNLKMEYEYYN